MRTLVVDDDAGIREVLRHALEAAGHAVVEAETWLDAVALLDSRTIELALVDGELPKDPVTWAMGPYGPAICQQARGLGVRTILMSGCDELVEQEEGRGFAALLKPFGLGHFLATVAEVAGHPAKWSTALEATA